MFTIVSLFMCVIHYKGVIEIPQKLTTLYRSIHMMIRVIINYQTVILISDIFFLRLYNYMTIV